MTGREGYRAMPVQTDGPSHSEPPSGPDGPKPALAFNRLCKSFDGIPVLREITARFMPGTVNVLAGENGAGKSTLFKIISGQLAPDSGILALKGAPVLFFD